MMHKTQIFNANMGDHYRNRLTHTLEVAQISRSIGKVLGLNDELIEAIALGHDLGHTPFGHIGERTLDGILHNGLNTNIPATGGRFKHNFQSLKVVDQLETRCEDYAGINLTLATREGILKHTKTAYAGEGFLHYPELDFSNIDLSAPSFTLEGQVVAISDEIAQCTHDLEDGVRSKIISFSDIQNYPLVLQVIKKYDIFIPRSTVTPTYDTRNLIIKNLVGFLIEDVCIESQKRISLYTKKCGIPDANKGGFKELCISFSPDIEKAVLELLSFIKRLIVCSEQITISDSKSKNIISSLFEAFYLHPKQLPDYALSKYCKQAEIIFDRLSLDDFRLQQDPAFVRAISDHIAGMTDQYAARTFTLLTMPEYVSSPHSCVGIVRRWVPREHIAEGFAVGDCNADADGITIRVNHRRQMAGGVLPVCHSLLRNPFWVHDSERCQVGAEAVRIPGCCHSLTFRLVIMAGVQVGGAFLRRIHEGLIHRQFWNAVLLPYLVDAPDHFLPNLHICRLGTYFLHRGNSGIRRVCVNLHAVRPVYIEVYLLADIPEPHIIVPCNVIGGHGDLPAIHIDLLPSRFCYDSCGSFARQSCADNHARHHGCDIFLVVLHVDAPFRFVTQSNTTARGQKLYDFCESGL